MAIKISGPLSISDLAAEFLGPYNLGSYYRGGSYVPDVAANANVPTSGPIRLGGFYGAVREYAFALNFTTNNNDVYSKYTADYQDVNLRSYLLAQGWNPANAAPHRVVVNIAANVVITSSVNTNWAFTIGSDLFPTSGAPMVLTINNYGYVMGIGGRGSFGVPANTGGRASTATAGGPGLRITGRANNVTLIFNNYGLIGSGGGGGGGGGSWNQGQGGGGGGGRPFGRHEVDDRLGSTALDAIYGGNFDSASWMYGGWMVRDGYIFPQPGQSGSYWYIDDSWWGVIPLAQRAPAGVTWGSPGYPIPRVFNPHGTVLDFGKTWPQPTDYRGIPSWSPYDTAPYQGGNGGNCGESGIRGLDGTDNSQGCDGAGPGSYAILGTSFINTWNQSGQILGAQGS
jgi:hypothetical protein